MAEVLSQEAEEYLLVVDDMAMNMRLAEKQLAATGLPCRTLKSATKTGGRELTEMPKEELAKIKVIFIDHDMPCNGQGLSGSETVRELRERGYEGIIVGNSGQPETNEPLFRKAGVDIFVSKPWKFPEITPKIQEALGKSPEERQSQRIKNGSKEPRKFAIEPETDKAANDDDNKPSNPSCKLENALVTASLRAQHSKSPPLA